MRAISQWAVHPPDTELQKLEPVIFSDGRGLPPGSGSVASGHALYEQSCVRCHGRDGRGGYGGELASGNADPTRPSPDQSIGSYWRYGTTLFEFMPRMRCWTWRGWPRNRDGFIGFDGSVLRGAESPIR